MRNLPEAETSFLKITMVYKGREKPLVCDINDFLECESSECALELFDLYVKEYVNVNERRFVGLNNIRGGKVFIYEVDNEVLCLCVHRAEVRCLPMCKSVEVT